MKDPCNECTISDILCCGTDENNKCFPKLKYDEYQRGFKAGKETADILIDLLVNFESDHICEEMDSYELNDDNESWCSRNCKYSCPQKECYLKYLEFVRSKNGNR